MSSEQLESSFTLMLAMVGGLIILLQVAVWAAAYSTQIVWVLITLLCGFLLVSYLIYLNEPYEKRPWWLHYLFPKEPEPESTEVTGYYSVSLDPLTYEDALRLTLFVVLTTIVYILAKHAIVDLFAPETYLKRTESRGQGRYTPQLSATQGFFGAIRARRNAK